MKNFSSTLSSRIGAVLAGGLVALAGSTAFAVTFTNNTILGPANLNYEGADIVVSNCTLTVDGPHTFSSVRVSGGGTLTHSFAPTGSVSNIYYVTNEAQIMNGTFPVILNSNVLTGTLRVADLTGTNFYTNGFDYSIVANGNLTEIQRTAASTIPDGATVLVSYQGLGSGTGFFAAGVTLTVTGNVQVDASGAINANGLGTNKSGIGGGSANGGSGGGYGGGGGAGAGSALGGPTYGSFQQPTSVGSTGGNGSSGPGGLGGGLIQIAAGGSVIVNGAISANGANGTNNRSGGGSGGSVYITALSFAGSGNIAANGGAGEPSEGGGGGGGRISLQYSSTSFSGLMTAVGGNGFGIGAAGTIYTKLNGQNGLVTLDNGGRVSSTNTVLTSQTTLLDVLIRSNATLQPSGSFSVGNLTIASNGFLVTGPQVALNIISSGTITVKPGGGILANSKGSSPGSGSGPGHVFNDNLFRPGGGGGYGGNGGGGLTTSNSAGGSAFGNPSQPSSYGSGGGTLTPYSIGGAGGGAIQITSLQGIVQVDGVISANGGDGTGSGGGGGSGGSISITSGTLVGSGTIAANGGMGANTIGGGGGGGRISITPSVNIFAGTVSAYGGNGGNRGGAGTILVQFQPQQNLQLIIDNGGIVGTNTPVTSLSTADLIVRNGAIVSPSLQVSFANLFIGSNSWITGTNNSTFGQPINLTFTGNATIQQGGGIMGDLMGSAPGAGSGAGHTFQFGSTNICSGAGHGGPGGNSYGNLIAGGSTYDTPTLPSTAGSGGGSSVPISPGGSGGGVVRLTVSGTLELAGSIFANGGNGTGVGGGGGSGGSISLFVGTLSGSGNVAANGGAGADGFGGGGGGGMIYLSCNNNSFSGSMTSYGGGGANRGGAGTTVIQTPGKNTQLVLDGGGNSGARTPLPNSGAMDVVLRNGAVGFATGPLTLGNLTIGPTASLFVSNYNSFAMVFSSVTVQTGGSIVADAQGFAAGLGSGSGRFDASSPNYACGGGANIGPGGSGIGNLASGGPVNPFYYEPLGGSGGGSGGLSLGGTGGGVISITTTGLLQIDGLISANGGNGTGFGGGGGAGGAIALTGGTVAGNGIIRANGGSGASTNGGGGGGGWISITTSSSALNQFAGTISAYGGSGANGGGPGLISTSITGQGQGGQYVLDNGGNPGAPTPITLASPASLTVRNGAVGLVSGTALALSNLLVTSNSTLLVSNLTSSSAAINLVSATIQAGGIITSDAQGFAEGLGTGAGHVLVTTPNFAASGAGHGGAGGNSITNGALGGPSYDSQTSPVLAGSGGGFYLPDSVGGAGGGAFSLTVSGLLQVDGILSANGGNGSGVGGGGGSGGSIKINAGTLAGGGAIRVNGGNGADSIGGGGAGGCIALIPNINLFVGSLSASGGGGANRGGAGTIYIQNGTQTPQLVLDNAGQAGARTQIGLIPSSVALVLRNGAVGTLQSSSQTFASLTIASNAWLVPNGSSANGSTGTMNLTISGNATIQAGGGIAADNVGFGPGQGTGAGHSSEGFNFSCSGGGYGGLGGNAISNLAPGGTVYASVLSPSSLGSGGGNFNVLSPGGTGGGAVRLSVTGTLDDSGTISANGGDGSGLGGGGGSGGSVWLTVGTLAGNGVITANGGDGANFASGGGSGGGGGGRIALTYNNNSFIGAIAAYGGQGFVSGGAGTIYTKANNQSSSQVLVDNGGVIGTNTPLSTTLGAPATAFNLTIQNGGMVSPQSPFVFPLLNSLTVGSGGLLTGVPNSTLDVLVFNSVNVVSGGAIAVDGEGYPGSSPPAGPGKGQTSGGYGSGAGYGGVGGASVTVAGGPSYGSALHPVDFGSSGGPGSGAFIGGSAGGGALRLNVGGILTVDGEVSAEGSAGLQDNSGGGSGGSVWVTTGALTGGGLVAADGGDGEFFGGGGGAGGRIALYSRTNAFFGGTSVFGGGGDFNGGNGTVVLSNSVATLLVLSNTPVGVISNAVNSITVYFSGAPNPNTVSQGAFTLTTPYGVLDSGSISVTRSSSSAYILNFPGQTAVGNYSLAVGQSILDLYGRPLAQIYNTSFSISLPVIQGTITDTNGNPIAGVTLQPSVGSAAITDTNGNYSLGFVPGTSFAVTPSMASLAFTPVSLLYTNISASITGQNYTGFTPVAPAVSGTVSSANFALNWQAVPGVNYQIYCSSNLTDWVPWGGVISGSNGPTQVTTPTSDNPRMFFSVRPAQ